MSSSAPRLEAPSINSAEAAAQAISEYDTNHDGAIDGAELDKVPGLKNSLAQIDLNGDKKITADEIEKRINLWKESKLSITSCQCTFTLDGQPLADAEVTFVPEKFLGPAIKTATGKTNPGGMAVMSVENLVHNGQTIRGVNLGFYKIVVSKKENGKETIPARYNEQTELGQEIAQANLVPAMMTGIRIDLQSK